MRNVSSVEGDRAPGKGWKSQGWGSGVGNLKACKVLMEWPIWINVFWGKLVMPQNRENNAP